MGPLDFHDTVDGRNGEKATFLSLEAYQKFRDILFLGVS